MNILIIGSGAREHAICVALTRSIQKPQLYCCGTNLNPGIEQYVNELVICDITHPENILAHALSWKIDLAIIGPEAPLAAGVADILWENHIRTVGPKKALAQIETNKGFARRLMQRYFVPGLPKFKVVCNSNLAKEFLHELGEGNYVIKANGLMGGKGVKVAGDHLHSINEAIQFCEEIFATNQLCVIEEKLIGQEFSFMCFSDGKKAIPMPIVQDHKRAYNNDEGPNTGGMGSYSDANHRLPFLTELDVKQAWQINEEILNALLVECQEPFIGFLYGSFITTRNGVYAIEFNARLGDPEALNVLSILQSDFVDICQAMTTQSLTEDLVKFASLATVCKYAVPEGYPDKPLKNISIDISAVKNKDQLYLASVDKLNDQLIAKGSRTAACVGIGSTISQAEIIAESEIRSIKGPLFHREDIGTDSLIQQRIQSLQQLKLVCA